MADERAIAAVLAEVEWIVACVLARYSYGDGQWESLDAEERNAISEPYLPRARQLAPMVLAAIPGDDTARALTEARDEISRMLDGFPQGGRHTRARWALLWLDHIIDRRVAHAADGTEAGR